MVKCLVCGKKTNLVEVVGTNSQYDRSWICEGCLQANQDAYENDLRNQAIPNSFGG